MDRHVRAEQAAPYGCLKPKAIVHACPPTAFALQAGGEGSGLLAHKDRVPISPDTLLRLLNALSDEGEQRGPRVLGVDDGRAEKEATPLRHIAAQSGNASAHSPARGPHRRKYSCLSNDSVVALSFLAAG
jgi:hypothetical protein